MTKQYTVEANGTVFGTYAAGSEQAARDLCAQDAGYKSEADMVEQLGEPSELVATEIETWRAWIDGARSESVEFHVPVRGTFDVAEAGAKALGVDVSEKLNVERV